MKQYLLLASISILLAACSSAPETVSQAPLDMKAVQEYQAKVYSGNTVPESQKNKPAQPVEMPLNASDYSSKTKTQVRPNIVVAPSVGYYHGRHWSHWY